MRVRLKDVAERAGVAINTASTILNKKSNSWASKETEARVFEAAKALGYKPNRIAIALSTGSFKTIGLVIPDLHNPFFTSLAEKLEMAVREKDHDLIIETTRSSIRREHQAIENICERQIDGLVCALINNEEHNDILEKHFKSGKAIVGLKEAVGPHTLPIHTVEIDFSPGLEGAIDCLLAQGHEHFIFLLAKTEKQASGARPAIFESHLKKRGVAASNITFASCDYTLPGSRSGFLSVIAEKKLTSACRVAVIAHNDLSALGVMRASIDAGLKIPENVAVVGVDNTLIGEHSTISLSTIAQPMDYIVQNVVNLLFSNRIHAADAQKDRSAQQPQQIILPSWFIPRESTRNLEPAKQ